MGTNKKRNLIFDVGLVLALALAFVGGYFLNNLLHKKDTSNTSAIAHIIQDVAYIVDPITGEAKEVTDDDIADAIVNGLLDDYSAYYTEEEYQELLKEREGNRAGLGFSFYSNQPIVFKVYGNSPAHRAGFMQGDKVLSLKVDDGQVQTIKNVTDLKKVLDLLKEEQTLSITFERDGEQFTEELMMAEYETSQVEYKDSGCGYFFSSKDGQALAGSLDMTKADLTLDDKTAYIRLDSFENSSMSQIREVLDLMASRGREKLILDLRDNGGGNLNVLLEIASYLIYNEGEEESLIVFAQKKNKTEEYYTTANNFYSHLKEIYVLANENTASASECLIGAMLHYGDCFSEQNLIVEKNAKGVASTFGKGVMQTTYTLQNGGALKLTTGRVLFPDKTTCINEIGIMPIETNAVEKGEALAYAVELIKGVQLPPSE